MRTHVTVAPLTPDRWGDFCELFDKPGQHRACSCMWWTLPSAEFNRGKVANRAAMHERVRGSRAPGLLAYVDGTVAGWISVAPRTDFGRVERSPKLKPIDDEPAWAVTCFWIDKAHRGRGIAKALLDGAIDFAREHGARLVEAYPVASESAMDDNAVFSGTPGMFAAAGFRQVAHRGGLRAIWRKPVRPKRASPT